MVSPNRVTLLLATREHLEALQESPEALGRLIGSPVPEGWPEFPEAVEYTLSRLRSADDDGWSMHFFLDTPTGALIGSGGYVAPPDENSSVEIGYEIAPIFRGRGLGTAAAGALVAKAAARGVAVVTAHTLPEDGGSTRILTNLGFSRAADVEDPEQGVVWHWVRATAPSDGSSGRERR